MNGISGETRDIDPIIDFSHLKNYLAKGLIFMIEDMIVYEVDGEIIDQNQKILRYKGTELNGDFTNSTNNLWRNN